MIATVLFDGKNLARFAMKARFAKSEHQKSYSVQGIRESFFFHPETFT